MANTCREFPWQNLRSTGTTVRRRSESFPPNGYGLYDMTGNVWEWTRIASTPRHPYEMQHSCCGPSEPRLNPRVAKPARASRPPAMGFCVPMPRTRLRAARTCARPSYCLRYRPAARQAQTVDPSTATSAGSATSAALAPTGV